MERLVAVVPTANEVTMVDGFVDHHRRIGVAHQLFVDLASTDGTRDLLADHAEADDVTVLDNGAALPSQGMDLHTEPFAYAVEQLGASWVTWLDADERLLVDAADVGRWGPQRPTVVGAERMNAVFGSPDEAQRLLAPGGDLVDVPVAVETDEVPAGDRLVPWAMPWVLSPLAGRALAPARPGMRSLTGGHDVGYVDHEGERIPATGEQAALVVHLPFTTFERFERKVAGIARIVERMRERYGQNVGWHWHRWVTMEQQGLLRAEFDRQFMSPVEAADWLGPGTVTAAGDVLATLRGR